MTLTQTDLLLASLIFLAIILLMLAIGRSIGMNSPSVERSRRQQFFAGYEQGHLDGRLDAVDRFRSINDSTRPTSVPVEMGRIIRDDVATQRLERARARAHRELSDL